jgi:hypothetical protein
MGSEGRLEQDGKLEHPISSKTGGQKYSLFLNELTERVYVPDKMSLKMNGAEGQPGQPLGV